MIAGLRTGTKSGLRAAFLLGDRHAVGNFNSPGKNLFPVITKFMIP
jgi:hypothetical protein